MQKDITLLVNKTIVNSKDEGKQIVKDFAPMTFNLDDSASVKNLEQVLKYNVHSTNKWEGRRNAKNNTGVYGISLDYDKGKLSVEGAKKRFSDYVHIIYTTSSHTDDHPRIRVILPFGTLLYADGAKQLYDACKSEFIDADSSCFEPGHMFFPCCSPGREKFKMAINTDGICYRIADNSISSGGQGVNRNRKQLPKDTPITLANGSTIPFHAVAEKESCHCPDPKDHSDGSDISPSAFCSLRAEDGRPFISCSACNTTFFCGLENEIAKPTRFGDKKSVAAFREAFETLGVSFRLNEFIVEEQVKAPNLTGKNEFVSLVWTITWLPG